jgi:cobalamin-dependent methionine synthase I
MISEGIAIIGERINYGIPRVRSLFQAGDMDGLQKLAQVQVERGAEALDVNIGPLPAEAMKRTVEAIQSVVRVPLCLDSTSPEILRAGIESFDSARSDGLAILNSATESRGKEVFEIRTDHACRVIILVSERREGSSCFLNETAAQALETARRLFSGAVAAGFAPVEIFIDPSTPALACDLKGLANTALETIRRVREDRAMKDVRIVAGLSNLTAGLPAAARLPLQNAFLTLAARNGLDTIIGDPARDYRLLGDGHPDLVLLEEILARQGTDRLKALTSSAIYRNASSKGHGQ